MMKKRYTLDMVQLNNFLHPQIKQPKVHVPLSERRPTTPSHPPTQHVQTATPLPPRNYPPHNHNEENPIFPLAPFPKLGPHHALSLGSNSTSTSIFALALAFDQSAARSSMKTSHPPSYLKKIASGFCAATAQHAVAFKTSLHAGRRTVRFLLYQFSARRSRGYLSKESTMLFGAQAA